MEPDLPPLIRALLDPQRYAPAVARVELVQTHISWVLLAGDFAYKIKKPIKLSFLDFSTLALRQHYCQEELRLNRRFAPDIYLDVVGIYNSSDNPQWQGSGAPIEYAVKMRRFDESARLDRLCERAELRSEHLSDLAQTLVIFHAAAARAPAGSQLGSPQQVMEPLQETLRDLLHGCADIGLHQRLAALRQASERQFEQLAPLMQQRQCDGWVRECHGDLHLANLVLIDQRVRLFDGIEFSDQLRWIDVASEIAFTYMDLLAHEQPGLACWFVNEVLSRCGDYEVATLLRFYAVYRALVRAKVAALRANQTQSKAAQELAYIALAERLLAPQPLRLIITHGLSGCGKTVASAKLLQSDSAGATLRLRSDVERKRMFALEAAARSGSTLDAGIYNADAHARTYARLRQLAEMLLRVGWSVVVDATFLKRAERDSFARLAQDHGASFGILAPVATPAQLRERILARQALGSDASEATLQVLARQISSVESLTAKERAMAQFT